MSLSPPPFPLSTKESKDSYTGFQKKGGGAAEGNLDRANDLNQFFNRPLVSSTLDPLQFAYQPHVGVDDTIIYLLQRAYSSLDRPKSMVRIMFFDFSSAFNTIQPRLLKYKLEDMQVDAPTVSWIEDYLTGRPQFIK
ncbi:hypothetical protein SKAU_G00157330 [Synaphobranchus kaupii]|uniref:Reverse transcriptase domain-containing protein n=1 Tax=Synaphobranchus kaupii TaxID=118154 RepID=A0A9Q1IZ18_SYNKA|nr:hypothetical protein SKAU_G00157330 [Synaphobranchus kaupii]